MAHNFFPKKPEVNPTVYAYELPNDTSKVGELKIGYTTRTAKERIKEQIGATHAKYKIVFEADAIRENGTAFTDHDLHKLLKNQSFKNTEGEWFICKPKDVKSAYLSLKKGETYELARENDFPMRPEQKEAVKKTAQYFNNFDRSETTQTPEFLWNAKMRFGKTFTAYQLAKKMGWRKVLVLTFKPAVQNSWEDDLLTHVDFEGWQFVSKDSNEEDIDKNKPFVCFGSFQDFLGRNTSTGGVKSKNEWVHITHWDCVIFDEYHFGAWNENSKGLFEELYEDGKDEDLKDFEKKIGKVEDFEIKPKQ